ncbi:MAG: preprotein translocase subunit SecE [Candidatus Omnitrophica bacterium CG1_02_44_16]|nr:MAG: preprotein translocase subunit SecE [Candidatus Omnitrophica bacterium CG1_02_44_16]PIY83831.1 MAG: preprotein translocase subunit SecE [Candidatus Omnitrophica bacterium CG_4_10_14_0_8_um_filter_44_12]PIZ85070.1 MAG: preprotein translocase subunit SecE [Candidatus Omnitrophica bacterium CG_4_10_14_0_2_um_filter_44_9]
MANVLAKVPVFFSEVKAELIKVAWPSRKELLGATRVVIIVTALLTFFIGALDFILSKAVSLVLK